MSSFPGVSGLSRAKRMKPFPPSFITASLNQDGPASRSSSSCLTARSCPSRLGEVLAERRRHPLGALERRNRPQLRERLLLDRVRVREVRGELIVDVVGHVLFLPSGSGPRAGAARLR